MSLNISAPDRHFARHSLKDQTTALLRAAIISGQIIPGSKISERDVAELLHISRMPARDALIELERQGLIISRPAGRFVIELAEHDIRHLYQLRLALEKLAIELAISNLSAANLAALDAKLAEMRHAIVAGDSATYAASDLELHELLWQQAGNPYLAAMLNAMLGPISMFIAAQATLTEDWQESLRLHEQLLATIAQHNTPAALQSIEAHVQHSLNLALKAFPPF